VSTWIALLGVGLGSYAFRVVPLLVLDRASLSPRVEALVGRAGLAAITALIALSTQSAAAGGAAPEALAGVGVGAVASARRAPMLLVVAAGGAMYAAVRLGRTAFG
jgi:branched-subunit amino acid transport protein